MYGFECMYLNICSIWLFSISMVNGNNKEWVIYCHCFIMLLKCWVVLTVWDEGNHAKHQCFIYHCSKMKKNWTIKMWCQTLVL